MALLRTSTYFSTQIRTITITSSPTPPPTKSQNDSPTQDSQTQTHTIAETTLNSNADSGEETTVITTTIVEKIVLISTVPKSSAATGSSSPSSLPMNNDPQPNQNWSHIFVAIFVPSCFMVVVVLFLVGRKFLRIRQRRRQAEIKPTPFIISSQELAKPQPGSEDVLLLPSIAPAAIPPLELSEKRQMVLGWLSNQPESMDNPSIAPEQYTSKIEMGEESDQEDLTSIIHQVFDTPITHKEDAQNAITWPELHAGLLQLEARVTDLEAGRPNLEPPPEYTIYGYAV